ncbi:MAG: STAS domain-containing protein [Thermodesulfobacteriota bacterium]
MLKINHNNRSDGSTELKLKGEITDSSIHSIRTECLTVIASGKRLVIDLGSVTYIDPEGVKYIKGLIYMNLKILNIPLNPNDLFDIGENSYRAD